MESMLVYLNYRLLRNTNRYKFNKNRNMSQCLTVNHKYVGNFIKINFISYMGLDMKGRIPRYGTTM